MQFSFHKINIEAPFPTTQCGHLAQTFLVTEFKDHLYARAVGIKTDNNWIIHLSMDLLCFNLENRNMLQEKIREYYHNDNIHLITSTTHTHYANSVRGNEYLDWLMVILFEGIKQMEYKEYDNVTTSYQYAHTNAIGKSRISGYESNNEYLCLVRFYSNDIPFFTFVYNNCHPTILSAETHFFSAEYPGVVLKLLEDKYPNETFSFFQGAAGDISSRFVREGQKYEDVIKLGTKLYKEIEDLLNKPITKEPLKLIYKEVPIKYEHDCSPVDLSMIRSDLTDRELETIKLGQIMRQKLESSKDENGIFQSLIQNALISSLDLGSVKIKFYPNEMFSDYINFIDVKKEMLVSYSNGYGPYILPIDFPYITYEMFTDTLSRKTKEKIIEIIKTI